MATTATETSTTSDGPVLSVISKRLRNLRKKLNRITQMEHSLSLGKTLNSEQLDVLNSKPAVVTLIDELTKLRPLLSSALDEELQNTLPTPTQPINHNHDNDVANENAIDESVRDLVNLMYFGTLFDVKQQSEYTSLMFTRIHERDCCLTYDYVGDDDDGNDVLVERDLDLVSGLKGLLVSKPGDSTLSHEKAIRLCLEHAKLWIRKADRPISPDSNVTYASLREKLNKIMSSDYFTATPQMKGPGDVAAAVGNFAMFQAPTQESMMNVEAPIQGDESPDEQYQEKVEDAANYKEYEIVEHESGNGQESVNIKEPHKDEVESENYPKVQSDKEQSQNAERENYRNADFKDQQYVHQRSQRGGRGRRDYPNGRGGRGGSRGNGPHQNGRHQHYDNYYPRNNYYTRRGGRGGAGGGGGGGGYYNSSGAQGNHSKENIGVES